MNKKAIGSAIFFQNFSNLPKKLEMARPVKEGLEYFPVDATIFNDRKIKKLIKNYGCKGLSVYLCLLCEIYRDKGYYVDYSGDVLIDVASNLDAVSENLVDEVIKACLSYGLFDNNVFVACVILTSKGIQERYLNIKRTAKLKDDFRVITEKPIVITEEPPITPQKPPVITPETPQSKVKESKGNESKWNTTPTNEEKIELPEKYIGSAIEQIKFTKNVLLTPEKVRGMFEPFKIQNLNGIKFYQFEADVYSHFINWLKKQDFKNSQVDNPGQSLMGGRKILGQ